MCLLNIAQGIMPPTPSRTSLSTSMTGRRADWRTPPPGEKVGPRTKTPRPSAINPSPIVMSTSSVRSVSISLSSMDHTGASTAHQCLLLATGGIHAGKGEKVDHPELSGDLTTRGRQRRSPLPIDRQEGMPVELQQPDDDFAHNAAADWPQLPAVFHDLRFLEGVVPKRRGRVEMELLGKTLEVTDGL